MPISAVTAFCQLVQSPQIDQTLWRRVPGAFFKKLLPILGRLGTEREGVHSCRRKIGAAVRDATSRARCAQSRSQSVANPGAVRENEPRPFLGRFHERLHRRRLIGFTPVLAREEADLSFTSRWTNQPRQGSRLAKSRLPQ